MPNLVNSASLFKGVIFATGHRNYAEKVIGPARVILRILAHCSAKLQHDIYKAEEKTCGQITRKQIYL